LIFDLVVFQLFVFFWIYCLFVYNLPTTADEGLLYKLFSPYGAIVNVKIIRELSSGMCKGFGFVNYLKLEEAQAAIMALNGYPIVANKPLQVSFKVEKKIKYKM